MAMTMVEWKSNSYLAYELSPTARGSLLVLKPPKFEKVVCHHVTIVFRPTESEFEEVMRRISAHSLVVEAYGYTSDESLECISVLVNNQPKRLFNGFYHLTHSLGVGRKPNDSNKLLETRKGVPAEKFEPIMLLGTLKMIPL